MVCSAVTCASVSLAISKLGNGAIGFVLRAVLAVSGKSDSAAAAVHIHSCYSCITLQMLFVCIAAVEAVHSAGL